MMTMRRLCLLFLTPALILAWLVYQPSDAFTTGNRNLTPAAKPWVSEKLHGLPGLRNVGRLEPGLYRGAQPEDGGYETLREMGVRTVLNLRHYHDESEKVRAAGMKPLRIRMNMLRDPDPAQVSEAIGILSDPSLRPLYFHCALGEDRTGTVAAIYRMEVQGWPLEAAIAEMQDFGFNDIWRDYKHFVEGYKPAKSKAPQ